MKIIQHFILNVKRKESGTGTDRSFKIRRKKSEDLLLVRINEENGEECNDNKTGFNKSDRTLSAV